MPRAVLILPLLLAAACAPIRPPAPPPGAPGTNPAVVAACREEAARLITRQDRGQLVREEERDARLGSDTVGTQGFRAPIDRLGRSFRYEQEVEDCVRRNTRPTTAGGSG